MPTLNEIISAIGDSIEREEGYNAKQSTRAQRNFNPGNVWDGLCAGKIRRIWPEYPIDGDGFLVLPRYEIGRSIMDGQVRRKILSGETLRQLINQWDSSDPQSNRDRYVANVAEWTGFQADVPLKGMVTNDTHTA